MTNKRVLSKAVSELDKAKAPAKPKDIITDPMGQWKYPGQVTRIPSDNITMQGVNYPVWAQPNIGPGMMMQPGQDYMFPEADYVDEYPQMKRGGSKKNKKYTRNITATNKLFAENSLFKKPGKKQIYDPLAELYQDGGEPINYLEAELTDEEIQAYKDGGYIVEDISVPSLNNKFAPGGAVDLNPETMKKYLAALKVQENNESTGFKKNKWYPYPSSEKGTDTIAYGHKLLPGEQKYYNGITTQQAEALAMKDVLEKQTSAKGRVDKKYGAGTFDKLPQDAQMLLVDYQYNVGLQKFPKFVEAVVKGDKPTMLKEYERTSDVGKLTKRNNWTKGVIDELNYPKPKPVKKPKVADANLSNDEFLEAELTPQEIEWYKSQGYTVEELD